MDILGRRLGNDGSGKRCRGRNSGVVSMGRDYFHVFETVKKYLKHTSCELTDEERAELAREFASIYVKAAYTNAEFIDTTIKKEGIEYD